MAGRSASRDDEDGRGRCIGTSVQGGRGGILGCPHAEVNVFHKCTWRCEELVEKKKRMYTRWRGEKKKKRGGGGGGDVTREEEERNGDDDDDDQGVPNGVVVIPNAEPMEAVCWGETEAQEDGERKEDARHEESTCTQGGRRWNSAGGHSGATLVLELQEPMLVTGALQTWSDNGQWSIWSPKAVRDEMCKADVHPMVVAYDRFPDPAAAVRAPLEAFVEYAEKKNDSAHETELAKTTDGDDVNDIDTKSEDDDSETGTDLQSHERNVGTPLVLADWRDTSSKKMRKRTNGFTPAFLEDCPGSEHERHLPPQRPSLRSIARSEALDVVPRGGVLGLQKVGGSLEASTTTRTSWHAVVHGTRQVVVYAPEETKAIGGDAIVEGTSAYSPFTSSSSSMKSPENAHGSRGRRNAREETSVVVDAAVGSSATLADEFGSAGRRAKARIAILGPGDVLVVPQGWWWTALALETSVAVTGKVGAAATPATVETTAAVTNPIGASADVILLNDKSADIARRCFAAKRIGNDYFTKTKFRSAVEAYSVGIRLLSADDVIVDDRGTAPPAAVAKATMTRARNPSSQSFFSADGGETSALLATLLCNRAAAGLKLKRWHDVIEDCTASLRISHTQYHSQGSSGDSEQMSSSPTATTAKLYYRRARALEMIGDADGAVRDMKRVLELEPNNASALHCMREYSSILNRIIIVNRGAEDVKRRQVKGLYTGVPQTYADV